MIQVDMFEVQLGASVLLRFTAEDGKTVRVLADAGQGPPVDVHTKLTEVVPHQKRHIDLLIGTHYDSDHLDGFIPIIKDETITITEAWLPPIANDSRCRRQRSPASRRPNIKEYPNILHWKGIQESVLDLCATVPVHLVIAGGIVPMEGNGPLNSTARPLGKIVVADHPVAADATCARLMGFEPDRIMHTCEGSEFMGNASLHS
jgi:hypothetical protein